MHENIPCYTSDFVFQIVLLKKQKALEVPNFYTNQTFVFTIISAKEGLFTAIQIFSNFLNQREIYLLYMFGCACYITLMKMCENHNIKISVYV